MSEELPKKRGRPLGSKNKKKKKAAKTPKPPKTEEQIAEEYERKKDAVAKRDKLKSMLGRDIGSIPAIVNPDRRESCHLDLKRYCEVYFPETFNKPWSPDHIKAIKDIEDAVINGGLDALAMPRGSGKTSLVEAGTCWSISYGHRRFAALIGSDEPSATQMLDSIKSEFEHNDILLEDFPEICYPIRALEGTMQRAHSQLCNGIRTEISWKGKEVVFPTIKGSKSSGATIWVAGITGRIRGMKRKLASGEAIRPDIVILDDPQTDESAKSPKQNADRLEIVTGAVLGLAGPGNKIAGFMPCTVIKSGDMADTVLNQKLHPEWRGQRTKMVVKFPSNEVLWEEYEKVYQQSYKIHGDLSLATKFYLDNREEMDEGSEVSWESRFNDDEASALQHAMNLKIRDEYAFWAEMQNEPKDKTQNDIQILTSNEIVLKTNGYPRGELPFETELLTVGVDVQKNLLYYSVTAWDKTGAPSIVHYGSYPDQRREYFTKQDAKQSYVGKSGGGYEADLHLAISTLVPLLMDREWATNDGTIMKVDQMLIDANWEKSKKVIYNYCRRSPYGNNIFPSHGRYFGAAKTPMSELADKPGEKKGLNWVITYPKTTQSVRYVLLDTNYWKTWLHERISTKMGDDGCFTLFGKEVKAVRMMADHLVSEFVVLTEGRGRKVEEWSLKPGHNDNDLLDTTVLSCVAASMRGMSIGAQKEIVPKKSREKRKMSDVIAERRRNR